MVANYTQQGRQINLSQFQWIRLFPVFWLPSVWSVLRSVGIYCLNCDRNCVTVKSGRIYQIKRVFVCWKELHPRRQSLGCLLLILEISTDNIQTVHAEILQFPVDEKVFKAVATKNADSPTDVTDFVMLTRSNLELWNIPSNLMKYALGTRHSVY